MKFRIVSDDRGFKVQRKSLGFWWDVELPFGPDASLPKYFTTNVQARTWIKANYLNAEIVD